MLDRIQEAAALFSTYAWGPWLLVLLLGGGLFFLFYSRALPFRYLGHACSLLLGRHDKADDPGQISHFQALSSALAGTVGMGNIAGVALAIHIGGPGAIFWMWITAVVGIATKFFTCSLAVMYRGRDSDGVLQGGPMYVIREALPRRLRFLAYLFAAFGLLGCLPVFQANQLTQVLREVLFIEQGWLAAEANHFGFNLAVGLGLALVAARVVLGGLARVAKAAATLVPLMSILYVGGALTAVLLNIDKLPGAVALIVTDAFTGDAVAGGALLSVILYGVQRGAFSNEAGIGTEALAHGAARTREPIREGLVAMLGPVIDTLLVCSATAFVILILGDLAIGKRQRGYPDRRGLSGTAGGAGAGHRLRIRRLLRDHDHVHLFLLRLPVRQLPVRRQEPPVLRLALPGVHRGRRRRHHAGGHRDRRRRLCHHGDSHDGFRAVAGA